MSTERAAASVMGSCFSDKFKQQELPAWRPLCTPGPVLTALWAVGAVFVAVAVAALVTDARVREVVVPYGALCGANASCTLDVPLAQPLRLPVYVYYELDNYYQNYRLYVKSRSQAQLEGRAVTAYSDVADCSPLESANHSHNASAFYFPCGLIAWSRFNDTFALATAAGAPVPLRKDGIAWASDRRMYAHDPGANATGIRVVPNITDEDFLVWMRVAAFPRFRKLHRVVDRGTLPGGGAELAGTLRLTVANTYNVSAFGAKRLVLTELSWLGGRNAFLGWLYLAVGALYLAAAVVFTAKQLVAPRKFADVRLLPWSIDAADAQNSEYLAARPAHTDDSDDDDLFVDEDDDGTRIVEVSRPHHLSSSSKPSSTTTTTTTTTATTTTTSTSAADTHVPPQ